MLTWARRIYIIHMWIEKSGIQNEKKQVRGDGTEGGRNNAVYTADFFSEEPDTILGLK